MIKRIRNILITGAVVLVPVVLTWWVLLSLFNFLDGMTARWIEGLLGQPVPGLGLVVTVTIVFVTGVLTRSFVGRELISLGQSILAGTPIVRGVYTTIRQIVDAFTVTGKSAFQRVALIEYPRRGVWSIAFVTADSPASISELTGHELVSVFLPTTPNPTSGFLLMLPREEVRVLDIPVEDGLKLVISGGAVGSAGLSAATGQREDPPRP